MPGSVIETAPWLVRQLIDIRPTSTLEVGPGMGLHGVLVRAHGGDVYRDDDHPGDSFQTTGTFHNAVLDCVEVWHPYIEDWHLGLYDTIYLATIQDALNGPVPAVAINRAAVSPEAKNKFLERVAGLAKAATVEMGQMLLLDPMHALNDHYDLVIACDVLEHIPTGDATLVLPGLLNRCDHLLAILPPNDLRDNAYGGNPHEKHVSTWGRSDFQHPHFNVRFDTIGKKLCVRMDRCVAQAAKPAT